MEANIKGKLVADWDAGDVCMDAYGFKKTTLGPNEGLINEDDNKTKNAQVKGEQEKVNPTNSSSYGAVEDISEDLSSKSANKIKDFLKKFSFRNKPTRNRLTLISLALVNLFSSAANSLIAPFYPHEAFKKGLSQTQIGVIFGLFGLVIFLTAPVLGGMISKIGAKVMFTIGVFLCGICGIFFGTLAMIPNGTVFFALCFLSRSLEALGSSATFVATFAIIANEFPTRVAMVFGTLEIFTGLGFMVGPPIGGALYEWGGYGLPFYTIGVCLILCGITCWIILPIPADNETAVEGSTLSLFLKPPAFVISISVFVWSFNLGFLDASLANHLSLFGLSAFSIGWLFFLLPAAYALTAPLWGWIGDNKGYSFTMIIGGNFLCAIPYLLIGPVPLLHIPRRLWLAVISLAMAGVVMACAFVPTVKALLDVARENGFPENFHTYGLVSGLFYSAFFFGNSLGPFTMGGIIVETIGFSWTVGISALCFVMVGILISVQQVISRYCLTSKNNKYETQS